MTSIAALVGAIRESSSGDPRLWELTALCLLLGLLRALDAIPRDTLAGMLEALVGEEPDDDR